MSGWMLGIVGGSGLYRIEGVEDGAWRRIETPWGQPSDEVFVGHAGPVRVAFLPRHGRGHRLGPSEVNYRANIDVLKRAGCTDILSVSAAGSLQESYSPGDFVIVDQYIDRTIGRERSFFGAGCVAHVSLARPVCSRLAAMAAEAGREAGACVHEGGTYLAMEGPQFSTRAESALYRSWKCDVIGMTNMPEARLAREAELPYASIAMITDYDCWRTEEAEVSVLDVYHVVKANADRALAVIGRLLRRMGEKARTPSPEGIEHVLDTALVTMPEDRDPEMVRKLDAIAGRRFASWR